MNTTRGARVVGVVAVLGMVGAGTAAAPATAARHHRGPNVEVMARRLDGPFGLQSTSNRRFLVAESVSGQVTRVLRHGRQRVLIKGVKGVAGVAAGRGKVFAVLGGGDETGKAPAAKYPPSSLLRANHGGRHVKRIADLAKYELAHNPDGQVQFVEGKPVDALSNPFSMTLFGRGLLVADGGANDVLRVNPRTGHVSTFFVPPTVKDVKACLADGAQANPGTVGCDPVPTGVAVAHGSVYVSTLGAEVPGAGRIYRLNPRTGKVRHVYKGFTSPTGVAVSPRGTIFVSEVLHGAPPEDGPPPPGFDPADIGRVTRIKHGKRTHVHVTMPTGLAYRGGHLYASAWSIASFLGIKHAGQVVWVKQRAFH